MNTQSSHDAKDPAWLKLFAGDTFAQELINTPTRRNAVKHQIQNLASLEVQEFGSDTEVTRQDEAQGCGTSGPAQLSVFAPKTAARSRCLLAPCEQERKG